jgi:uncharacterized phage-associated protein
MTQSVHDVAAYILEKRGPMSAMKLQKLVYYAQAWSLVWDDRPLFGERIEAWANGPVAPELYKEHRGQFIVSCCPIGDASKLDDTAIETIGVVLRDYGDKPAQWLSDLTHAERPWRDAHRNIPNGERGSQEITQASMAEYYGGL